MRNAETTILVLLAALLALPSASALAQAGGSDKERRKAAREEQAQARADEEASAEAAARAAEEKAEAERLAGMGAEGAELWEAQEGFFVGIDAWFADPSGAERGVARLGDIVSSATTAGELDSDGNGRPDAFSIQNERVLQLEYDSAVAPRLEIGWRRGTGAAFSVRYSGFSSDASLSVDAGQSFPDAGGGAALTLGGLDNQGFENGLGAADSNPEAFARPLGSPNLPAASFLHGAESLRASGSLDANRLDLLYTHTGLLKPRIVLQYRVGLSMVNLEREESATFTWRSFETVLANLDTVAVESIETSSETQAFGVLAGIAGRFGLTEDRRWSLRAGLELSGLSNEQDLSFHDSWTFAQSGSEPVTTIGQDTTSSPSNSLLTTIEADVAVEARLGSGLQLGVGYRHASWLEAVTNERYPSASNLALLEQETVDVDFSGPYFRLSWFF